MIARVEVQPGRYHDSVRLMQASKVLQELPGIADALVAMGTELNLSLLADMGFDADAAAGAGPNDLLLAVRAENDQVMEAARLALEAALSAKPVASGGLDGPEPRTVGSVAARSDANVALLSMPGEHVFVEAMDALDAGLHVMIFSDNVPLEQEIALKAAASNRGLLVMGPDCGTAIVGGVGLGFANAMQPGPVGIVGASGTGIQELCCLLDDADVGVTHALGTGSRDLSESVGAVSTLQALSALDTHPPTELIVVISKPPAASVAARVRGAAAACSTPTVVTFMGETTIEEGAAEVLMRLGVPEPAYRSWDSGGGPVRQGTIRGLFSGGTLRDEARFIAMAEVGEVGTVETADGHCFVDYGDDEYTKGRAHPMIDQTVRLDRLAAAADDATIGVILMDVVLGYGANPDPASELTPMIQRATDAGAAVVVSLCGTRGDPQGRDEQAAALNGAGASVWLSNAAAAREAVRVFAATNGGTT
ncbi:MAG: FdrA family protein [Acidimicrobiia bacterium]|nr:FdrA family protein [Acidimicrobiia bacterium]